MVENTTLEGDNLNNVTNFSDVVEGVENLYYKAAERPKARLALALLALMRLGGKNAVFSRKELFSPIGNPKKKESKALTDEGMSKDWQRKFTDRLLKEGLIEINGNYISAPDEDQKNKLSAIALDTLAEGLQLKRMLWPSQYPAETPSLEVEAEQIQTSAESPELAETESFDGVKEIVTRLEGVQSYLGTMVEHLGQVYKQLNDLGTKFQASLDKADASNEQLEIIVRAIKDENRLKLTTYLERMVENSTRRKTLISQLTSDANQDEKLNVDLQKLLAALKGE